MASKKQGTAKTALEVGAVVAAAAAAGYYFYGDKNAKKHRAAASKWAKGMKADVLKEAKKLKKLDQKAVGSIVDKASAAYMTARSVDKKDVAAAARELKKHWKSVQAELGAAGAKVKSAAKKAMKKATPKKAVKKRPAKKAPKKAAKKGASRGR